MIEVLFGESEAGSMKVAKNTVVISKTDGPTSVWVAGKKKVPEREDSGWIEGTSSEVICMGFLLDIGDIKEKADSRYRKDLIYSMYAQGQWGKDAEMDEELSELWGCYCNELNRLKDYLEDGEPIRVWYSDAPYSLCGLYYCCSIFQSYKNEIQVVKLPKYKVRSNCIVNYQNWSEIAAEQFAGFLPSAKSLTREEIQMYAMLWSELKEARLIGDILGRNQISIGDWWYAKRIDYFIEQKKINVIEDLENKYGRMICLA